MAQGQKMCFHVSRNKAFPCLEPLHGNPWSSLGTPSRETKGDALVPYFPPVDVTAWFLLWTWGDKTLLTFILVLSSALSTPWTQSWCLLPIFLLSFYWPVSSHFQPLLFKTPPTWIIPLHPTLARLQKLC